VGDGSYAAAFERAREALDDGRLDEAETLFRRLIDGGGGTSPATWFNLGLVYKLRRDWQASVAANGVAVDLDPSNQEANWNMGVAATALRDWATARRAWAGIGLDVGPGDGPPEADFGLGPVRLNATSAGEGEVVWGRRIDPCRMRLESVPLPASGHRWGDVILHDVVPRGERLLNGKPRAVFDELIRMEPSPHATHEAEIEWATGADEAALHEVLAAEGLGGEDWSSSIRYICTQCSLSDAHTHASGEPPREVTVHRFALAGSTEAVRDALRRWVEGAAGRRAGEPVAIG
jgi:hypothetical protein